jgi:hypothetical protein
MQRVVKDMAITHADFFRSLQPLLEGEDHQLRVDGVTLRRAGGRISIRLGPERMRALGNFRLPRTRVTLEFRDLPPDEVASFLAQFDTRFRRGGG